MRKKKGITENKLTDRTKTKTMKDKNKTNKIIKTTKQTKQTNERRTKVHLTIFFLFN